MTFPTIPTSGGGRILVTLNTAGGATKTFPDLSSLTKNAGDLLIAIAITYDGNSSNAEFSSWGGSFTEFVDQATTTTMGIGAAYKFSTGSETGTFTVTTADTTANDSVLILMSIAGAHSSTAPEGGTIANGTGSAADPGALDPAGWGTEDTLWISVCGSGEDSATGSFTAPSAAPTNYGSSFISSVTADVVGGVYGAVAFRQNATGSENVGAWTVDLTQARNSALLIAVRPSGDATATPATIARSVTIPTATASGGATGVVTDDFNRANGAPGSDWQEQASGSFLIVSNQLVLQSGAGGTRIDWNHDLTSTDHYCEVDVTGVLTNVAAPVVRCSSGVSTTVGYIGFLDPSGTGAYIARLSDFGMVDTDAGYTHGAAHRLRLEAEGTTLRFYVDEGLVCSGTDSTFTTQVRVGASQAQTGQSLDNFEAGPLGGGGDGTASPAVIARSATIPAATPQAGSTPAPAVIARSAVIPAASATGGGAGTASPAVIARVAALPASTPQAGSTLAPATIARVALLPTATASSGGGGGGTPTVALLTHSFNGWDAPLVGTPTTITITSASISPGANCLLVAMLSCFGDSTTALASTLPASSGSGPTWTLAEKTSAGSAYEGSSGIWTAVIGGSDPGSFTVSAVYANSSSGLSIHLLSIYKITNFDTGTPTGGKETTTAQAGNGNVDITLDAAPGANDVVLAQCLVDENADNQFSTFGTGTWTTAANGAASTQQLAYNTGYRNSSTSTTVNWSDVNSGSDNFGSTQAAVVVKGGAGGGTDGTATPAVISRVAALPAPTATGSGGGTATPALIARVFALPAPSASGGGGGTGVITVVKTAHAAGATSSAVAATFTGSTTAGNLAIAVVSGFSFGSMQADTTAVTDNKGNTWTRDFAPTQTGSWEAFYSAPITTGGSTHTVTFNDTDAFIANLDILEISGHATPAFDKSANNTATGTTYTTGSTGTLAQADELVVVGLGLDTGDNASLTEEGTYTLVGEELFGSLGAVSNVAYRIVSSTTAINHAWTGTFSSGQWGAGAATYKAGAAGGDGTATPAVIARSVVIPEPSHPAGPVTPATINAIVDIPDVAGVDITIAPTVIARSATLPAPTATGGGVGGTASPAVIARSATLPAPVANAGTVRTVSIIARVALLPAPTASGSSSGTATPATIVRVVVMPAPTASGVASGTATPATIVRSVTLPAPGKVFGYVKTVAKIQVAWTIPTPQAGSVFFINITFTALAPVFARPPELESMFLPTHEAGDPVFYGRDAGDPAFAHEAGDPVFPAHEPGDPAFTDRDTTTTFLPRTPGEPTL